MNAVNEPAKFGVLVHRPLSGVLNIGDYIQAIAVRDALGLREFDYVQREQLSSYAGTPQRVVGQSWYSTTPGGWPPAAPLDFLPFAMHITPRSYPWFETPAATSALNSLGPIGCRDMVTLDYLRGRGIDSYFSGCLTLTLNPPEKAIRAPTSIYLVDVGTPALSLVPVEFKDLPVRSVSHVLDVSSLAENTHGAWLRYAEQLLRQYYEDAAVVVSARLHALLPCLAMGIPVIWVERRVRDRRLDLGRRYAQRAVLPRPDSLPKSVTGALEKFAHPILAAGYARATALYDPVKPVRSVAEERETILNSLMEAVRGKGWELP